VSLTIYSIVILYFKLSVLCASVFIQDCSCQCPSEPLCSVATFCYCLLLLSFERIKSWRAWLHCLIIKWNDEIGNGNRNTPQEFPPTFDVLTDLIVFNLKYAKLSCVPVRTTSLMITTIQAARKCGIQCRD